MRGRVVRFDPFRGYGFIKPDDGSADKFVHHESIIMDGYRNLIIGQRVEFEMGISDHNKKPMAVKVRPIGV